LHQSISFSLKLTNWEDTMKKKKLNYAPPKMQVIELKAECTVLTISGEYPNMPWGDDFIMGGLNYEEVTIYNTGTRCHDGMQ